MAEENTLKSIEHSVELSAENAQKVKEMGNDLIDKLSEKVEEGAERLDELRKEMNKRASGIGTPTEKFEKKIEDEVSEMLKETKEKLNDTVKNVDFSGVINNLTTFDEETQEKVSETFADIKDGMERFVDEMDKSISEKVDGLEESEKMERRTESENENIGGIISEKSTDFEEVCKETIVADRLEETVENKLAESVDDKIISEKVDTIGNENVKGEKEEEGGGANKMDELVNETFEKFQKLNVEAQMKLADAEEIIDEKLHNLKEGIDEKINEINMKTGKEVENNIICRSDKGEKIKADNDNIEKSEFTQERSIVAVDNDHLGSEDINHLQDSTLNNDIETVQGNTGESMIKLEHVEEKKAIKKIVPPGEDVPQQVGTISKSGTYHDDYETEKSEAIGSATLEDIVSEKVDVVDKLLEEAFNISEKMKEPETIEDVIKQQVCSLKFKFIFCRNENFRSLKFNFAR
uniref:GRIP domain-containing protein n=1 Tax=Elaeophora elaphi TaxID=1147741 RepID=A0A0R3RXK0_9BILA